MNIEKEDLYIFGVILSRYENPSYHEKKFINKYKKLIIKKPVETTNEQPKDSLTFDEEDLKPLYHLLSRTNSRKYMDELEVYLERLAFIIG